MKFRSSKAPPSDMMRSHSQALPSSSWLSLGSCDSCASLEGPRALIDNCQNKVSCDFNCFQIDNHFALVCKVQVTFSTGDFVDPQVCHRRFELLLDQLRGQYLIIYTGRCAPKRCFDESLIIVFVLKVT